MTGLLLKSPGTTSDPLSGKNKDWRHSYLKSKEDAQKFFVNNQLTFCARLSNEDDFVGVVSYLDWKFTHTITTTVVFDPEAQYQFKRIDRKIKLPAKPRLSVFRHSFVMRPMANCNHLFSTTLVKVCCTLPCITAIGVYESFVTIPNSSFFTTSYSQDFRICFKCEGKDTDRNCTFDYDYFCSITFGAQKAPRRNP